MNLRPSQYDRVNTYSLKSQASEADKMLSNIVRNLRPVKDTLSNSDIIPNGVGVVSLTALNFTLDASRGAGSINALQSSLRNLVQIANLIENSKSAYQSLLALYDQAEEERDKKGTEDYDRDYYNRLVRCIESRLEEYRRIESKIDSLVREICAK